MRTMGKYIVKRILLMFLTMFIIMTICFILIKMLPLPAVREMGRDVNLILAKREAMGYNKPLLVQYFLLLKNVFLHWDWGVGEQMYEALNVWDVLVQKLPYTVLVNLYSILLAIPLGLVFGIYAALKKNRWQDHVVSTLVVVFISVPSYVYAFIVQYLFCYKLGWFPLTIESLESTAFFSGRMLVSMMPAILSLGFGVIAGLTRYTRAELSEVLTSEFMLLARTKGLTKAQATSRHALRNAMVVILPMIIGEFIGILGGSLIIEKIFAIPGVGSLYVSAVNVRDYNFFMALTVFYTFIGLASSIVIDISYGIIDPRIRMGSKK
ncbi:MAG TPA: ABC transporter permease [Clostridia bacterium]|jgi:oligopeptide transport system permease protein|nr:ABC transporter permease [Clostridia bacterium]HPY42952.1 ABC transporter permease [Clostridia bacterium]HQA98235.1 ABC transporter permease [Clostridia bacterium]HQO55536.1 ABC transporter permease [Clostridia bacterium]